MPISYSKERKGWDLREVTEEEGSQIMSMGLLYLMQRLGASMVEREAKADADLEFLEKVPTDRIPQA